MSELTARDIIAQWISEQKQDDWQIYNEADNLINKLDKADIQLAKKFQFQEDADLLDLIKGLIEIAGHGFDIDQMTETHNLNEFQVKILKEQLDER